MSIPQQRVVDKLEEYIKHKDYSGAEKHLLYWLQDAEIENDLRGKLMVCNECIGFYRKTDQRDKALYYCDLAISLLGEQGLDDTVTAGTTYINAATALNAFGVYERSLTLFEKAKEVYDSHPEVPAHLLGGLYNNMGLTYKELERFDDAFSFYDMALHEMEKVPGGALEQAITCLNMADAIAARDGLMEGEQKIFALLDRSYDLLHDRAVTKDGYYAFVCEKCAPGFSYYGYFAAADELQKEAEEIYART